MNLRWVKVAPTRWESACGRYIVWLQATVREGASHVREYASQRRDEQSRLCERGTLGEAKEACQAHADGKPLDRVVR